MLDLWTDHLEVSVEKRKESINSQNLSPFETDFEAVREANKGLVRVWTHDLSITRLYCFATTASPTKLVDNIYRTTKEEALQQQKDKEAKYWLHFFWSN